MLVRIKGKVEDILQQVGTSKEGKHWAKKTYVIRDTMYKKDEYNKLVHVQEFGQLDPNATTAEFENFVFKSNHLIDEEVDLACYLETNKFGFTNVDYGKEYANIDKPKEDKQGGVVYASTTPSSESHLSDLLDQAAADERAAAKSTYNGPDAFGPTNPEASSVLPF